MSSVSSVEPTAQNFNPSWMRTNAAANRGGLSSSGGGRFASGGGGGQMYDEGGEDSSAAAAATVLSPPIVSEFSYTRDRLLELMPTGNPMPDALRDQLFFNENNLPLVSSLPMSETEQKLQTNVNSSKAMSMLSQQERAAIAAGAAYGSGYSGGIGTGSSSQLQNGQSPTTRWAPKSSWAKTTPDRSLGAAAARGGGSVGRAGGSALFSAAAARGGRIGGENGFGGAANGAAGGGSGGAAATGEDSPGAYQPKFTTLRRGGGVGGVGRGGSTSGATFNTRADALYNPNDPTDRPKAITTATTRSESDEEDAEGWSTVKPRNSTSTAPSASSERPAWVRSESWIQRTQQQQQANQQQQQQHWNREGGADSTVWKDRNQMVASVKKTSTESQPSAEQLHQHQQQQLQQQQPSSAAQAAPPEAETSNEVPMGLPAFAPNASTWSNNVLGGGMGVFYQPPPQPPQPPKEEPVSFYYMDPSQTRRGPFPKEQMTVWFKAGYFTDENLKVQRGENGEYKTIGELKQEHGAQTPFDYPEDAEPPRVMPTNPPLPAMAGFPTAANPMFPQQPAFGGMGMWSGIAQPNDVYSMMQSTFEQQMIAERQRLMDEHNRRLAEEAKKMADFQEAIYRQMTMQQELSAQQLREKEIALLRHREELERRDAELKQEALARQQKMESEARELEERKAALEMEARRKEMDARREKMEQMQRAEDQKREEASRAAAERIQRAEEAAEKERVRLEVESKQAQETLRRLKLQKDEEDAANLAKQELAKRQAEERERVAKEVARQQAELEAVWAGKQPAKVSTSSSGAQAAPKQVSPSGSDDSEGWTAIGEKKEVKHTKVAPWAGKTETAAPVAEKTLLEIQKEEERQMRAEREQAARMKAKEQVANLGSASAAAAAEKKDASWGGSKTWAAPEVSTTGKSYVSPFFDGPSLEAANKMALQKKNSLPKIVAPAKPAPKPAPVVVASPVKTVKSPVTPAQKKKTKQEVDHEALESWFVARFRILQPSIDAKMLYDCVFELDHPVETEDIIMSYVEDNKAVKEFVREFIKRRIALRAAGGRPDVDDLTSARAAQAAPSDSSNSNSGNAGGKKKKKNTKQVLDGNILGFRGAAASDRLNKGEIDAIPSAPVNPSRR